MMDAELKSLITDHTAKLLQANEQLKKEITAYKQTQERLRQDKERLELAIQGSNDGLWDWRLKTNEVFFSARWKNMLGFKEHEFPNHFDEWKKRIHPEDYDRVLASLENCFNGSTHYELEHRLLHKDGSYRWILARGSFYRNASGQPYRIVGLTTDITQRKQMEQALRESEKRLYDVLDNTSTVIYVKDTEGRYILINRQYAAVLNLNQNEMQGKTDYDFFPKEIAEALRENDQKVLQSGTSLEWEEDVFHQGSKHTYLSLKFVLHNSAGVPYAVCGMSTDITERKQTEEALKQSETQLREKAAQLEQTLQKLQQTQTQLIQTEKMSGLGQLVAGVAHEINNPVNFISGNLVHAKEYTQNLLNLLHLYQQFYPDPVAEIQEEAEAIDLEFLIEDLPKMLSSMKIGADRIRQIVLSLRNFSRLDEADVKPVDIHEGIDSTLLILQNRLKEKVGHQNIQVIKEYGNLPPVECYAGQMNQVFMNILANAIDALDKYNSERVSKNSFHSADKAVNEPSTIHICTQSLKQNSRVLIQIRDNGPGMTAEVKHRIFDPFFTTKPVGKGTGLGLSISYQIVVEKHRGVLKCFSEPGKGTEFWIEIPVKHIP